MLNVCRLVLGISVTTRGRVMPARERERGTYVRTVYHHAIPMSDITGISRPDRIPQAPPLPTLLRVKPLLALTQTRRGFEMRTRSPVQSPRRASASSPTGPRAARFTGARRLFPRSTQVPQTPFTAEEHRCIHGSGRVALHVRHIVQRLFPSGYAGD